MRQAENFGMPLHRAVTVQMRVFADLAWRSLTQRGGTGTSYCAWTRRGMLVVVARGSQAHALAQILPGVGITPQSDLPEQIDPPERTERSETKGMSGGVLVPAG